MQKINRYLLALSTSLLLLACNKDNQEKPCPDSRFTGKNCDICKEAPEGFMNDKACNQYKTVFINGNTWMAENMNYVPTNGKYYHVNNKETNDAIYGLLYDHEAALSVCPSGWSLPSEFDFEDLINASCSANGSSFLNLIAKSNLWSNFSNQGLDSLGFGALPAGDSHYYFDPDTNEETTLYENTGLSTTFWSSKTIEYYTSKFNHALLLDGSDTDDGIGIVGFGTTPPKDFHYAFSVRCIYTGCADSRFIGPNCDQCADKLFSGPNCDQCADSRFKGFQCNECVNNGYGKECTEYASMTDNAGKSYKTAVINGRTWMAENMKYVPTSGNYYHPGNNSANDETYGLLYDLEAAQTVCPDGWRLPTKEEAIALIKYAMLKKEYAFPSLVSFSNFNLWQFKDPDDDDSYYFDVLMTEHLGFDALPAGSYSNNQYSFAKDAVWWLQQPSGEIDSDDTIAASFYVDPYTARYDVVSMEEYEEVRTNGYAVRCIKDAN